MLTFEQIIELVNLVAERQLQGVEIERSGFRVKIDGKSSPQPILTTAEPVAVRRSTAAAPVEAAPEAVAAAPPAAGEAPPEAVPEPVAGRDGHVLTSPIVGTFYASPSPDSDPYVKVGEAVKKGQVLCIVEAMKLMNEIESDADGVIEEVYPKNAQPVEFGEPLFRIRTS